MRFEDALQTHLNHLSRQNFRPNTVKHHRDRLQHFGRFLSTEGVSDLTVVTPSIVNRFPSYLYNLRPPLGIVTQANSLQIVKSFFASLIERDIILVNPARRLPRLRKPVRVPPRIPTAVDVERMLRSMKTDTAKRFRDRTIFELFYATGMREDEIGTLKLEDFDRRHRLLNVTGKGVKDRTLPLTRRAYEILVEYVDKVRPLLPKSAYMFPNRYGKRLSNRVLLIFTCELAKSSRIRQHFSTHTFRHVLGTELLRNGANLRSIQEYLGHSAVQTTTIYTHVLGKDLKMVHRRTHPRERRRRRDDGPAAKEVH